MSDSKISELTAGAAAVGDLIPIARGSVNYKVTAESVAALAIPYVSTRTALAGLTPTGAAYLSESGREGWFIWASGNFSSLVTLDTYQGVYVPPTSAPTGASGCWVRYVPDNVYLATWFGVSSSSTTNNLNYNSAGAVIPNGATLVVPAFTHTVSAPVVFKPGKAVHLRGVSPSLSRIDANPATLSAFMTGGLTMIHLTGSKSTVKDLTLTGPVNNVPSGEPAALTLGKAFYLDAGSPVYGTCDDMVADNITVLGGSAGIRVTVYFSAKAGAPTGVGSQDWVHYDPIVRPVVRNCNITVDRAGIEYYGVVDARDENNTVTLNYVSDVAVFCAGIRVLGSQGFHTAGLRVQFAQEHTSNVNRYGIFVAHAGFNDDKWRPSNKGVVITDAKAVNATQGIFLGSTGTDGDVIVDGFEMVNPIESTVQFTTTIVCDLYTNAGARMKRCSVRNVKARGQANVLRYEMPVQHFTIQDVDWVQNSVTADTSTPIFRLFDVQLFVGSVGGYGLVEIERVKIRSRRTTYGEFTIGGMAATTKVVMNDNWSSPDGGAGFTQIIRTGTNTSGSKLITDGVTEQDLSGVTPLVSNRNYRYPTGAWSLATG